MMSVETKAALRETRRREKEAQEEIVAKSKRASPAPPAVGGERRTLVENGDEDGEEARGGKMKGSSNVASSEPEAMDGDFIDYPGRLMATADGTTSGATTLDGKRGIAFSIRSTTAASSPAAFRGQEELVGAFSRPPASQSHSSSAAAGLSSIAVEDVPTTPLIAACRHGQKDVVNFLIENGADIDEVWAQTTPLVEAVRHEYVIISRLLLYRFASIGKCRQALRCTSAWNWATGSC
jgi:hypothetical protein